MNELFIQEKRPCGTCKANKIVPSDVWSDLIRDSQRLQRECAAQDRHHALAVIDAIVKWRGATPHAINSPIFIKCPDCGGNGYQLHPIPFTRDMVDRYFPPETAAEKKLGGKTK